MALSKRKKIWLIIIGSIIAIFIILLLIANSILSTIADQKIREELDKMDSTGYIIDFDKVRINLFTQSARIYGLSIQPDSAALEVVKRSRLARPLVEANIRRIRIGSIDIRKAMSGKEFGIGSIAVNDPEITIYGPQGIFSGEKENPPLAKEGNAHEELDFTEIRLGSFEIENANIKYIDARDDKIVLETRSLNIIVDDIWAHQPEGDTNSHVLEIEDLRFRFESHMMELPGNFYKIQTGYLEGDYKEQSISLESLKLIPAYPKNTFGKAFGKQTDRFDVQAENLSINGIVFDSLIHKKLIIDKIQLTAPNADIYRDKRVARDMNQFPKLFQTAIADIPIPVYVKSISILNGFVNYQEMIEDAPQAGSVTFGDISLNIAGVCNDPDSIRNGQAMIIDAKVLLMDKTPTQMHFNLPIGEPDEYFTFYGNVSSFPAESMNQMIKPLAFIATTAGTVSSTRFFGMAKRDTAVGRIELLYNDLEVQVIKKKKEEGSNENKFLSFLAKTVMHKNNPNEGKDIRIAKMYFVRDPNKGFFNFIWKTIQDGLITRLTPGKKNFVEDMDWTEFQQNWKTTLSNDWSLIQAVPESEKKKRKRNK